MAMVILASDENYIMYVCSGIKKDKTRQAVTI
jgi:hypothetical protein